MSIHTIFIYLIASFFLFILLNYIDKKSKDNYINYIFVTIIYIIILAGIFSTYNLTENNDNIFLISVFELLIKVFYTNYIQEISFLKNNKYNLKKYILTIIISYLTNELFISKTNNVFPGIKELKIIIWLLIIIYIYILFKEYITINPPKKNIMSFNKDKEYIVMQYAKLKNKYFDTIKTKYQELIPTIYAIMIYENHYKPEFFRKIDLLKYKLDNEERKFGIMQITSKHIITDEESINLAIKNLEKIYLKLDKKKTKTDPYYSIIKKYYHDETTILEVTDIYKEIINFEQKK